MICVDYFADNILLLVLRDLQKYSEKSENIIGLDSYILNNLCYTDTLYLLSPRLCFFVVNLIYLLTVKIR